MADKNPFASLGKIIAMPVEDVIPYDNNPKLHSDRQLNKLANSIRAFGFNVPIIVDELSIVLAGHGRLLAAKFMGMEVVPVIQIKHLSEVEKKAYRLADNKITEDSRYDEAKLFDELKFLADFGSIEVTGFTDSEMLALEMQAKASLDAASASLKKSEPTPKQTDAAAPGETDPYEVGMEPANDHDESEEFEQDDADSAPSMVRLEVMVDDEQRRAIIATLNKAKDEHSMETLGASLHMICMDWLERN